MILLLFQFYITVLLTSREPLKLGQKREGCHGRAHSVCRQGSPGLPWPASLWSSIWRNLNITSNLKNVFFSVHQMCDGQKHIPPLGQFYFQTWGCRTHGNKWHLPQSAQDWHRSSIQALWAVFPFWEVKALSVCGPCPQAQRLSDSVLTECYNSTLISQHIPTYIFCMKQKLDETIFSLVLCDTLSVFKLFLFLHKELMNALPTPTAQVTSGSVMTCGIENSIFCFILSVLLNLKIFCEKPEHVKLKMILF